MYSKELKYCPDCGEPNAVNKGQQAHKCRKCRVCFNPQNGRLIDLPEVDATSLELENYGQHVNFS